MLGRPGRRQLGKGQGSPTKPGSATGCRYSRPYAQIRTAEVRINLTCFAFQIAGPNHNARQGGQVSAREHIWMADPLVAKFWVGGMSSWSSWAPTHGSAPLPPVYCNDIWIAVACEAVICGSFVDVPGSTHADVLNSESAWTGSPSFPFPSRSRQASSVRPHLQRGKLAELENFPLHKNIKNIIGSLRWNQTSRHDKTFNSCACQCLAPVIPQS